MIYSIIPDFHMKIYLILGKKLKQETLHFRVKKALTKKIFSKLKESVVQLKINKQMVITKTKL